MLKQIQHDTGGKIQEKLMLAITQEANEYRKNFHSYYYQKIVRGLARFEEARKVELVKWSILVGLTALTVIIGIIYIIYLSIINPALWKGKDSHGELMIYALVGITSLWTFFAHQVSKKFENKVKKTIMHAFLSYFGDFSWSCKNSISNEEINESKLVGNYNSLRSDDYFEGTHRGLRVVISENKLIRKSNRSSTTVFEGLFIKMDLNKNFYGHTIVFENNLVKSLLTQTLDPSMEKVELEDPEFNKLFDVYTQDQVEARFILTTTFIERFKNLRTVYKSKNIRASFLNNAILIALPCKKDMFLLGKLTKPIVDASGFQLLFEEFVAVLSLAELLNLDSKTGL